MAVTVETHTLIIWPMARQFEDEIINVLKKHFQVKRIFDIQWDSHRFAENLKTFYSHSQKHLNDSEYNQLIQNKISHCGNGIFCLVVFEDQHPLYENRITSSGARPVNKNIFDLKQSFRMLTGGGHKIHTSDNVFESNKDLTLLLHKNCGDFNACYPGYSNKRELLDINCAGVDGFQSIRQLFYVLNNSIEYGVMRNFECLPDAFTVEGHGDVDLLVADFNYIKYLTHAKSAYPELDYRVHFTISIAGEMVPFDFRYVGDNYYDTKWQMAILKNRKLFKDIIFVPDDVNYFYSLLYHAYVQKAEIKEDYHDKLSSLALKLGLTYDKSLGLAEASGMLDSFMQRHHYQYTIPNDKTVYFNKVFLEHDAAREEKYGNKISVSQSRFENKMFFSEIYLKGNVITKIASIEIIENELRFLTLLKNEEYFPKVLRSEMHEEFGLIQMEKIEGPAFVNVGTEYEFWKKKNICNFINDGLSILKMLGQKGILHRDIRPENLILKSGKNGYRLVLIDFGWATTTSESGNDICPYGLGDTYKFKEGEFSDAWSMGKVMDNYFGMFSIIKQVVNQLQKIEPEYYKGHNPAQAIDKIRDQFNQTKNNFNLKDKKWIWMQKNPMLKEIAFKFNSVKSSISGK